MDRTPWSSVLLLLLAEQAPSATQAFVPSLPCAHANTAAATSTTCIARRWWLPELHQVHVGLRIQPSSLQIVGRRTTVVVVSRSSRRPHAATIMDVDGQESSANGVSKKVLTTAEVPRPKVPWQQPVEEAGATVDLPSVEMPLDLPQPGEWLHVPLGNPGPSSRTNQRASLSVKLDPFSVPDNVYRDSWLDSVWINLISSRMSAAVEAEERVRELERERELVRERCGSLLAGEEGAVTAAEDDTGVTRRTPLSAMGEGDGGRGGEGGGEGRAAVVGGATMASSSVHTVSPSAAAAAVAAGWSGRSIERSNSAADVGSSRGEGAGVGGVGGGVQRRCRWRGAGYTYEDYVDLATRLQAGPPERQRQVVGGVLRSIFPSWFPAFYRTLFPVSKFSSQVNALMCPPLFSWLVGKSELMDGVVDLKGVEGAGPSQEVWRSTVKVERCRYLEASKCKGTCMNLCKLPTEAFFREDLGMPLRMTPNFEDLSCEFAFGQAAAPVEDDPLMQEPCWTECLSAGKQPKSGPQRACHTMPESPLQS